MKTGCGGGTYASLLCQGAGLRLRDASPHSTLTTAPPWESAVAWLQVRGLGCRRTEGAQPPVRGGLD